MMYKIIALMALIMALMGIHVYDKRQAVNKAVKEVHQSYIIAAEKVKNKAKEEKIILLSEQQKEREIRDEKINSLNTKLANANRMLLSRKERPKDSGEPSSIGSSCTGRELYRQDGEFLIGEAARADKVVIERDYYFNQYEKARLMIKRINNGN